MNFYDLKQRNSEVYGAILLDKVCSKKTRKVFRSILFYVTSITFIFMLLSMIGHYEFFNQQSIFIALSDSTYLFRSVFVLFFSIWFGMYMLELMYLSYYFKETKIDFEILELINKVNPRDLTSSFIESEIGAYSLLRLGFSKDEIKQFIKDRTDFVSETEFEIVNNNDDIVTFAEFGYSLTHFDSDFSKLLKKKGVTVRDFKETLDWISRTSSRIKNEERWWSKDRLARIPSIGKNWSFGQTYYLDRFGHTIYQDSSYFHLGDKWRIYKDVVNEVENILVKDSGSNVMITSREAELGLEIVAALGKEIIQGTVLPELESKRIYVVDINLLIATFEQKSEFETMLQQILYQASGAGNVILVFPNFSDFVENTASLETDVKDLIGEVMNSTNIQVVAISNQRGFHESVETDLDLMRNFEKILVEDLDENSAIQFIEDEVFIVEAKYDVFFTFQALKRVVESADRYFSESSLSDKAMDILTEVAAFCRSQKIVFIDDEAVSKVVESKTGIPLGVLSKSEKEKLSKVELILKKRVIGQDRAIEAISDAMKRARIGVANPKRPLGSFLFIGPTGVGKTEASKALAEVFFGDEENMTRIDMSEFNDSSSVSRLIGDNGQPGILSSKIREDKYGVLLLDEFEKAHPDVHNLFLQILDEGYFSDGVGEKVNARNMIIIATSNAGSDLMYKSIEENINLQSIKEKVVDYLIEQKIFRPEFLNRFDDVVLFNSLDQNKLQVIAGLMINKLNKRLEDKGLDVKVNDALTKYLVLKGQNIQFGAREINRVIQKEIEAKIANALISGEIQEGDTITFVLEGEALHINKII